MYLFHTLLKEVWGSLFDDAKERLLVFTVDESVVENSVDLMDPQADQFVSILTYKANIQYMRKRQSNSEQSD